MNEITTHEFGLLKRQVRDIASVVGNIDTRLRAENNSRGPTPVDHFTKAVLVKLHCRWNRTTDFEDIARSLYGPIERRSTALNRCLDDPCHAFTRAASGPATIPVNAWAGAISPQVNFAGPLASLSPASLYATLAARGQRGVLSGNASVSFPNRGSTPSMGGQWVGENSPIRVAAGAFGSVVLNGRKVGVISIFSNELGIRSTPDAEQAIRQAMSEDTSLALDATLIDTTAGSTSRPAGLLNGITPLAATTGGGVAALAGDLGALAAAIPNPTDLVFLMTASERTKALTLSPGAASLNVIEAPLPAKQVVALDASDLATVEGDTPTIMISDSATVHEEDTAPLPLSATGTPPVVAAPIRSMLQTDCTAVRLLQFVGWGMRRANRIATIANVTW
jgi:Phage capsid family